MNGIVCGVRIMRWIFLVKGTRIMNMRWIRVGYEGLMMDFICRWVRVGYEVVRIDLICRLNGRYNSILSLKIINHLIKPIWIHRCQIKSDERFDDGWNMNLGLGEILDFMLI